MDKKKKNAIIIIICFVSFLLGVILLSYDYILSKRDLAFEKINMEINGNKQVKKKDKKDVSQEDLTKADNQNGYKYDYVGTLEIPKINLTKGFVDMNSRHNNVDYNIQIIKPSNYPDVENGNLIFASHSGSSSISYFKKLYKLSVGDEVNVYYKDIKYKYRVDSIYNEPKTGYLTLRRNREKTTLTMITCTRNSNTKQTIYISYLEAKEEMNKNGENQ